MKGHTSVYTLDWYLRIFRYKLQMMIPNACNWHESWNSNFLLICWREFRLPLFMQRVAELQWLPHSFISIIVVLEAVISEIFLSWWWRRGGEDTREARGHFFRCRLWTLLLWDKERDDLGCCDQGWRSRGWGISPHLVMTVFVHPIREVCEGVHAGMTSLQRSWRLLGTLRAALCRNRRNIVSLCLLQIYYLIYMLPLPACFLTMWWTKYSHSSPS